MKTKHTSGPWNVDPASGYSSGHEGDGDVRVRIAPGNSIATAHRYEADGITSEQCWANARLIAAAPDLLDALKDLAAGARRLVGDSETLRRAEAAIAKAEGSGGKEDT